jgi:hypothetical protein
MVLRLDDPAEPGMTFRVLHGGHLAHEAVELGGDIDRTDLVSSVGCRWTKPRSSKTR